MDMKITLLFKCILAYVAIDIKPLNDDHFTFSLHSLIGAVLREKGVLSDTEMPPVLS